MPTPVLLDKFDRLETALRGDTVERETEIMLVLTALVAGVHLFFWSAPGRAKSMLVERTMLYIAAVKFFHVLCAAHMKPEQMYGPLDASGLLDSPSRYEHLIDGMLPDADVAFLDEMWKVGQAILNGNLGILNERKFKNGKLMLDCDLHTAFIASNEGPQGPELAALDDRLPLRVMVDDVSSEAFVSMLELEPDPNPKPIMAWADVKAAHAEAMTLPIRKDVLIAMRDMRDELRDEYGIEPTPRRWMQLRKVLRGYAWLDGADEVCIDHLAIAEHSLWTIPEERDGVRTVVIAKAAPLLGEVQELLTSTNEIDAEIDRAAQARPADATAMGEQIHSLVEQARLDYFELVEKAGSSRKALAALDKVKGRLHELTLRMVTDVFALPSDQVNTSV